MSRQDPRPVWPIISSLSLAAVRPCGALWRLFVSCSPPKVKASFPNMSGLNPISRQSRHDGLRCPVCHQPVSLESSKTDEKGRAVHEECYVARIRTDGASQPEKK